MTYLDTRSGRRTRSHPEWRDQNGAIVSDALLAANGIYRLVEEEIAFDPLLDDVTLDAIDQWPIDGGVATRTKTVSRRPLGAVKNEAMRAIDAKAESFRAVLLTPGSGQALEYDETRSEADKWRNTPSPDVSDFPMLAAELAAAQAVDPSVTTNDIVLEVETNASTWRQFGAEIKRVRRTAKLLIENTDSHEYIRQVYDWASSAYQEIMDNGAAQTPHPEG